MKRPWILLPLVVAVVGCARAPVSMTGTAQNPFLTEWNTPFGVPDFDRIEDAHYLPAFTEGMKRQVDEVRAIAGSTEPPTFANTVEALERSGALLTKVSNVFFNMTAANTNDTLQSLARELAPVLSKHQDDIFLNEKLFQRVEAVYAQRAELDLDAEQQKLLEKQYKNFVRGGARLDEQQKAQLREINKELSVLTVKFGENVLKETNAFELVIEDRKDLAGLSEAVVAGAAEAAAERGHEGRWVFTLQKPSLIPFLQYSERRGLREKIFKAYVNRGNNGNEFDNNESAARIAALRARRAALLGYDTHADYVLEENMAKTPEAVYELLNKLWKPALAVAKREAKELQATIDREGRAFRLQPWDWWYYAEKVRKEKYDLDEEALRPYFKLENVIEGVFTVANRLYGIRFDERTDLPRYHKDVRVFEVKEADGSHIGILYVDYFPRESKRGGAWMNSFRKQSRVDGRTISPVICNVGNFSKPTADQPSLLSFEEVNTLFHEFGHALHGLPSEPRCRGTSWRCPRRSWRTGRPTPTC
jgi:peptidyl-dipeptidase Dcp